MNEIAKRAICDHLKNKYTGDHIHAKITWILPTDNPFHNLGDKIIMALKYQEEEQ